MLSANFFLKKNSIKYTLLIRSAQQLPFSQHWTVWGRTGSPLNGKWFWTSQISQLVNMLSTCYLCFIWFFMSSHLVCKLLSSKRSFWLRRLILGTSFKWSVEFWTVGLVPRRFSSLSWVFRITTAMGRFISRRIKKTAKRKGCHVGLSGV